GAAAQEAEVGVDGGDARALRVQDQGDAGGEEGGAVAGQGGGELGAQLTVHRRDVDASLFEDGAAGEDARGAAAAAGALPGVAEEAAAAVFLLERGADAILEGGEERLGFGLEIGGGRHDVGVCHARRNPVVGWREVCHARERGGDGGGG